MCALTGMAARAHQATTSAAAALANDSDIYTAGFGTRGTLEHSVDMHALNLQIKIRNEN